jgi:hypothetical protein
VFGPEEGDYYSQLTCLRTKTIADPVEGNIQAYEVAQYYGPYSEPSSTSVLYYPEKGIIVGMDLMYQNGEMSIPVSLRSVAGADASSSVNTMKNQVDSKQAPTKYGGSSPSGGALDMTMIILIVAVIAIVAIALVVVAVIPLRHGIGHARAQHDLAGGWVAVLNRALGKGCVGIRKGIASVCWSSDGFGMMAYRTGSPSRPAGKR